LLPSSSLCCVARVRAVTVDVRGTSVLVVQGKYEITPCSLANPNPNPDPDPDPNPTLTLALTLALTLRVYAKPMYSVRPGIQRL